VLSVLEGDWRERAVQLHLIHLICGSTGAGKTTYALRLSDQLEGIRFSIDEWMAMLFWMDTPQPLNPAWSIERVETLSDADIGGSAADRRAKRPVRVGPRLRPDAEPHQIC
jgi:hypothetical protein